MRYIRKSLLQSKVERKDCHLDWKDGREMMRLSLLQLSVSEKASLIAQLVKNLPAVQKTLVQFLYWENLLEKG